MKVLLATYCDRSVFHWMVPIGWALLAAGHDVVVASTPGLVPVITGAGLTAAPVGRQRGFGYTGSGGADVDASQPGLYPPYDVAVGASARAAADAPPADVIREGYEAVLRWWHKPANVPMISDLVSLAREWRPDLVLWEPVTYAGALAAAACGAAHGRVLWGLDVFGATRDRVRPGGDLDLSATGADPLMDWIAGYARRYGVAAGEELVYGQFTLDPLPPSLAVRRSPDVVHVRYVPYGGRSILPHWLHHPSARPRITLTLGITATERFARHPLDVEGILDELAGVAADRNAELVAALGGAERPPSVAADLVRVASFVPLHPLALTSALVVHHAGVGTTFTSALAGVPQLMLPHEFDEPELARRVAASGAGLALDPATLGPGDLRGAVERLLDDPRHARSAAALREEMLAAPAPSRLVGQLKELAAAGRGASRDMRP